MDTGQGRALMPNMDVLGIRPETIDHLVLSHGHFDHTGGMEAFLLRSGNIPLWAHEDLEMPHTRLRNGEPCFIGCHINSDALEMNTVRGLTQVTENIWALEIPVEHRDMAFVSRTDHLVVPDGDSWKPDLFPDDLSLVVKGDRGISVVLGCAHAGVVNILEEVARYFDTRRFHTVVGGMHLAGQTEEFVSQVTGALTSRFAVEQWRPCHCTGFKAACVLSGKAGDLSWAGAGTRHEL
ncbi:MAG: MBL fold metallo-hydrolase [Synergistales bacterium]|nr:MBL fold metallo-hydrolase [Synergistales bacterium]